MEIKLGDEAIGLEGSLGKIHRFFMDPKSQRAEQMSIKLGGGERVVSPLRVTRVENDKVYLDLDKASFDAMPRFDERAYKSPGIDPSSAPIWQQGMGSPDIRVEMTPGGIVGPIDEPVGERLPSGEEGATPADEMQPVISRDTDIIDVNGEKAGKVGEFIVDSVTGAVVRLGVHEGLLFGRSVEIPLDLVSEYGAEGIIIKATKDQIK